MTKTIPRRRFLGQAAAGTAALSGVAAGIHAAESPPKKFRVWTMGCSHVGTDLRVAERESLAEAIRHSEQGDGQKSPPFEWDIALHLGDFSGAQGPPDDEEGKEVVRQFSAARKHRREHFYNIAGNHDASGPNQPSMEWFQKWIDPEGKQTQFSGVDSGKRPYPITGTWERYSFRVGNLLFLMMSDRNDGGPPVGRGKRGGYPAGAVTGETFAWWKQQVEENPDAVILSAHHHMLKETTVASGPWEGFQKTKKGTWRSHYHGYYPKGGPKGASYLYFVDEQTDAEAFESYLSAHPQAIDFWLGGHTHAHPDDNKGNRRHIERKWGVNFVNVSALARYHARKTTCPMSRLLTFTEGSDEVRVQCYLHTSDHAPQGWYPQVEQTLSISRPFEIA